IEVRSLVEEHVERTGSPVGRRVLDEWDELLGSFVKVFPADYKRVLAEHAAAESAATNGSSNGALAPAKKAV
ncbi:MAG: glutamate synthase large chain, partial [Solirubrobacteraceae bacterium]|nr:glutamate synthase large chain [Solirubrobacteraceae bacterium]